jgi:hypothetical protein
MRRFLLVAVGIALAIPLSMALIGLCLPPSHEAVTRSRLAASPRAVWATLADFPHWPDWNPDVRSMERGTDRDGKPVWVAHGEWGAMPSIVEHFEPPRLLVTRIPEDAGLGFHGSWTYELAPAGEGTLVTITERGTVDNPLFRFIGTAFFDPHATAHAFLVALGQRFGEQATPQPVP